MKYYSLIGTIILIMILLFGCSPEETWTHFGEEFSLADPVPLSQGLVLLDDISDSEVFMEGVVKTTCQNRGGSMILQDGDAMVRVRFGDHDFYLPYESKGMRAKVQGKLNSITISEELAKNWAERFGYPVDDPDMLEGEQEVLVLTASGVAVQGEPEFSPEQQALIDKAEADATEEETETDTVQN